MRWTSNSLTRYRYRFCISNSARLYPTLAVCSLIPSTPDHHEEQKQRHNQYLLYHACTQPGKVRTDTTSFVCQTRYRTNLGWFVWFVTIHSNYTTKIIWQILYRRTRYRTHLAGSYRSARYTEPIRPNLATRHHPHPQWRCRVILLHW